MESAQHGHEELVGVVQFCHNSRDFGFISPESGGSDVFFHLDCVVSGCMRTGLRVTYNLVLSYAHGGQKLHAEHVIGAPIPSSCQLEVREQLKAVKAWRWYKKFYASSFDRGHDGIFSKPCMPATFVVAASCVAVKTSASICAPAASVNTLPEPEDSWVDVHYDSKGDIDVESAAPSSTCQGGHRAHAEPMAIVAARSPAADIVESWEDLISEDDQSTTGNWPSLNVMLSCRNTCLHVALVETEQSSRVRAHSAPPRSMSHCEA